MDRVTAPGWWTVAGVQVAVAVGALMLPAGATRGALLLVGNLCAVAALVVAARRTGGGTPWWVLAAAQLGHAGAWACWYVLPTSAAPTMAAHLLYVASHLTSAAGLTLLARRRGVDSRAVLDAAILATALAVVLWVLLVNGTGSPASVGGPAAFAARAFVVLGVWLAAVAAALTFTGVPSACATLLFGWAALQLVGDSVRYVQLFAGSLQLSRPVLGWLLMAQLLLTVAALCRPAVPAGPARRSWVRPGTVVTAVLALPALLVIRSVQSSTRDVAVIAAGSVVVTALAVSRTLLADRRQALPRAAGVALRRSVVRLCIGFLALAMLPLAGLTYLSVREANQTVEAEVQRRLTTSADVTTAYIRDHMAGLRALVTSYAERRLLADALARKKLEPAELQRHVAALESRSPNFVGAWVVDARGTMLAFDPPQPSVIGGNFGYREYFTGPRQSRQAHITDAFESTLPGRPRVVAVSAPVVRDGRFLGVIALGYRLESLHTFTDELARVQHIDLKVTDRRGTLLTDPRADLAPGTSDKHVVAALGGRTGSAREVEHGVDTVTAYQPIGELGWAVVAEVPAGQAYAGVGRFTGRILAVASLLVQVLLLGLVLAVRVERRRRAAEAALGDARDEALTASRMKSDFVANMSHEIRTPMNGVIGLTTLLAETVLDARQRDYVTIIQNSADALLNVINDILDFSKIEAGKLAIDPVDFDPRTLAEEVTALVAAPAHSKGLEIAVAVRPALPPALRGDAHRIRQVLTNLVSNAVKFTSAGEVVVEVTVGEPAADTGVCQVTFAVTDTGIGIRAEHQHDLFEAFTQADTSTTRRYGGTGLGLSISRHLVRLMGGTIGLRSEVDRGSTFHFTLPLPLATADPRPEPVPADLSGLRVLVVDDNPTNRRVLVDLLSSSGIRPSAVVDGPAALQALRTAAEGPDPYRIALLDRHMPGMDGIELAGSISADGRLFRTRLAMLTSADQCADVAAARAAGVGVYLTKPVRAVQLRAAILELLHVESTAPATTERPGSPPVPPSGVRILVAEDNEVNQQVITAMLGSLGYDCDLAPDGEFTLRMVQERHYDVVLMDVQMPNMDGLEATRRLRQLAGPVRDIPVVALTASALPSDEQRCHRAGMNHFLSKPIRKDQLAETLRAAVPQRARPTAEAPPERAAGSPPEQSSVAGADFGEPAEVLDPAALAELRDMGPAFLDRLVPSYVGNARAAAIDITAAAGRGDLAQLARTAHKLKGSSGTLGGRRVAATCADLEQAAQASDLARVRVLAATTARETERFCEALQAALQPHSSVDV